MADWDYRPEEEKKEKEKKYVTRREFYLCFIILLAVLFFQNIGIKDRIRQAESYVSNAVHSAEGTISSNISSIPRNIEQGIEDANNPFRETGMEIVDVDAKAKTATIRIMAAPKEYQKGMIVKFMVSYDGGEAVEVPAAADNDRVFEAELTVPYCDVASATVHLQKNETETIRHIADIYIKTAVLPVFDGEWSGGVTWQASQNFVTFDGDIFVNVMTPGWMMNLDKGTSFDLKNEKVEVYINRKLQKNFPVEVTHEDEYNRSYIAYVTEENKIKLGNGKEIEFIFKAEDNNGLKYSYLVEKGAWDQNGGYENDAIWNMPDANRLKIE